MCRQSQSTTAWLDRHVNHAVPEAGKRRAGRLQSLSHTIERNSCAAPCGWDRRRLRCAWCYRSNHNFEPHDRLQRPI